MNFGINLSLLSNVVPEPPTDFQSDSHWGWPDSRGLFDVAAFAKEVQDAGLERVPAHLEIIYPFELAEKNVPASITTSICLLKQWRATCKRVPASCHWAVYTRPHNSSSSISLMLRDQTGQ